MQAGVGRVDESGKDNRAGGGAAQLYSSMGVHSWASAGHSVGWVRLQFDQIHRQTSQRSC